MSSKALLILLIILLSFSVFPWIQSVQAFQVEVEKSEPFLIQTSLYTHHWANNQLYNNNQKLVSLEYMVSETEFYGLAHFQNSFFQPCLYLYTGKIYNLWKISDLQIEGKLTLGVITGYKDEGGKHEGVLNKLGTFPAIIPAIGVRHKGVFLHVILLAGAGFMVAAGIRF